MLQIIKFHVIKPHIIHVATSIFHYWNMGSKLCFPEPLFRSYLNFYLFAWIEYFKLAFKERFILNKTFIFLFYKRNSWSSDLFSPSYLFLYLISLVEMTLYIVPFFQYFLDGNLDLFQIVN